MNQGGPSNQIKGGTVVFAAFAVISLIVSAVNGVVPIYLVEAAMWGGLAWYWQSRNEHSKAAKGIVVIAAVIVTIGEVIHFAARSKGMRQQPTPLTSMLQTSDQPASIPEPKPVAPCPSGMPSGATTVEIPSDQVTAKNGQLWYEPTDKLLDERGGWYFHFTITNNTKGFCVTRVDYTVKLDPENGATLTGHGHEAYRPLVARMGLHATRARS